MSTGSQGNNPVRTHLTNLILERCEEEEISQPDDEALSEVYDIFEAEGDISIEAAETFVDEIFEVMDVPAAVAAPMDRLMAFFYLQPRPQLPELPPLPAIFGDGFDTGLIDDDSRRAPNPDDRQRDRAAPLETDYDTITQDRAPPQVLYGQGESMRQLFNLSPAQRPRLREIPLRGQYGTLGRVEFRYRHAPHLLDDSDREEHEEDRIALARRDIGPTSAPCRWVGRGLVEMRQARALAGLDTSDLDHEIARRVLQDPPAWGQTGHVMALMGWVDDAINDDEWVDSVD